MDRHVNLLSMIHRRFGRTGISMPVLTCGGMRYQHKWDDVPPADIPMANQQNLEAHDPPRAGTRHQPHRNRPRLRHLGNAARLGAAQASPRQNHRPNQGGSLCRPAGVHRHLRTNRWPTSSSITSICSRFTASTTRTPRSNPAPRRLPAMPPAQLQQEGRARYIGFSTHAPLRHHPRAIDTGEFDYVNLHWYWVNDHNWPAVLKPPPATTWACSSSAPTTRAANSTNRPKNSSACASHSRRWPSTTSTACPGRKSTRSASVPRDPRISTNTSKRSACSTRRKPWSHPSTAGSARQ